MASLVHELQALACDSRTEIADLVRKALLVSTKLGLEDFRSWLKSELNGYENDSLDALPEYRRMHCEIKYQHPMYGLRPIHFEDIELEKLSSISGFFSSIGHAQYLLEAPNERGLLHSPLPAKLGLELVAAMRLPSMPSAFISRSEVYRILDAVRNIILSWSLKLEESGIVGEEMTFSSEEKEKANFSDQLSIMLRTASRVRKGRKATTSS